MMRIVSVVLVSAVVGILVGGAVAYIDVASDRDAIGRPGEPSTDPLAIPTKANVARVQVDQAEYDFGTMPLGRKRSHTFVLKNVGTAPLTLGEVSTSCSCTVGAVHEDPIPPGGTGEVRLEWTARGGSGPFRQTGAVRTNDPLNSQVQLVVQGQVTEAQGIEPTEFSFDTITAGEQKTAEVYVMAMLQDELTVTDPVLSDSMTRDKFDVKIEPVAQADLPNPKAKAGVRIKLTAKPGLPIGRLNQWLALTTNLEDGEHQEIPIVGRLVGDISVHGIGWSEEQAVLQLGTIESSQGKHAKLNLVVRGADAANVTFEVQSCTPPELKAKVGEPRKLKDSLLHVPVAIEVPIGTRPMVHTDTAQGEAGRIVLNTTHPTIKELVLSVRFSVER